MNWVKVDGFFLGRLRRQNYSPSCPLPCHFVDLENELLLMFVPPEGGEEEEVGDEDQLALCNANLLWSTLSFIPSQWNWISSCDELETSTTATDLGEMGKWGTTTSTGPLPTGLRQGIGRVDETGRGGVEICVRGICGVGNGGREGIGRYNGQQPAIYPWNWIQWCFTVFFIASRLRFRSV